MAARAKMVELILWAAQQIATSDAAARDAMTHAAIACDLEDYVSATVLYEMAVQQKVELMTSRVLMTELAGILAKMPVEPDSE